MNKIVQRCESIHSPALRCGGVDGGLRTLFEPLQRRAEEAPASAWEPLASCVPLSIFNFFRFFFFLDGESVGLLDSGPPRHWLIISLGDIVAWSCVTFEFAEISCGFASSWSMSFSFLFFFFPCTTSNGSYFGFVLIAIALLSPSVSEACWEAISSSSSLERFVPASFPFRRVVSLEAEL